MFTDENDRIRKNKNNIILLLTQVNGSFSESIQLVQAAVDGDVAHKVKGVLVLCWGLCVKLKHLLSAGTKTQRTIRILMPLSKKTHKNIIHFHRHDKQHTDRLQQLFFFQWRLRDCWALNEVLNEGSPGTLWQAHRIQQTPTSFSRKQQRFVWCCCCLCKKSMKNRNKEVLRLPTGLKVPSCGA